MVSVTEQYDAFPYPERDPADETSRLILGSPSHPVEMDHFLWGGRRDWTKPLRVLVAGGGTGDGLVQLAALLAQAGKPYQITYIDLSQAARKVAESRIKARGLPNVRFETGSLLDAPEFGQFDYIDCCGVLHHLPDPDAGFKALRAALAPDGGLGFMVYAPLGRSGVYPLQESFGALLDGLLPKDRLRKAREIFTRLPDSHPFKTNPHLVDHDQSDAGFYDLLLHGQDRAYDVPGLLDTLDRTDWQLSSFTMAALYDLGRFADVPGEMVIEDQWAIAEKLNGTIKSHVGYAVPKGVARKVASGTNRSLVPHIKGVSAGALAKIVSQHKPVPVRQGNLKTELHLPATAAPLINLLDGKRSLTEIARACRIDDIEFGGLWVKVEKALAPWGLLLYSGFQT